MDFIDDNWGRNDFLYDTKYKQKHYGFSERMEAYD